MMVSMKKGQEGAWSRVVDAAEPWFAWAEDASSNKKKLGAVLVSSSVAVSRGSVRQPEGTFDAGFDHK